MVPMVQAQVPVVPRFHDSSGSSDSCGSPGSCGSYGSHGSPGSSVRFL